MNESAEDYLALQARYERLNLLHQVSNIINSTLDAQKAFDLILREAVRLMRATSGSIALINPTTGFLEIQAACGLPPQTASLKLRVGEGITGWVAQTGAPIRVGDVKKDHRYIMVGQMIKSELAVPLEVNGELRGALNVDSDRENAFSLDDQEMLQDLAIQAARVIHNAWLYEQIRLKARLFETLASVSQTINNTLQQEEALQVITREACQLMNAKVCSLLLLDESRQWLELRACHGAGPAYISKPRLNVEDSLVGAVVRRKKALQVENVQISSRYQSIEIARQEGLVSLLSVPLLYAGQAIGVLSVYTQEIHSFSNEEIKILTALAELSGIAIEKARLYERMVEAEEQLRQSEKLSALGLLAAEVAHEIRNPLTVINMLFHSLNLEFPENDPRAQDIGIIGDKMEQLNKIVERALDFARSNEPKHLRIHLNQLIEDLGLLIRHKVAQQNVKLEFQLDHKLPVIIGDPTQLEQAFLNLALNALEAMPHGGKLTVRSYAQNLTGKSAHTVFVEFIDTGEGMTEDQKRNAFTSLLNTTKRKGTGLGLAIVAKVIEAHQGSIHITSEKGVGTTFTIKLTADDPNTAIERG